MKHIPDIQELLDRYWEGETTLEEERRLKAFFASGDIPAEYRQEARLFQALLAEQALRLPDTPRVNFPPRRRTSWIGLAAVAILALLCVGIWWFASRPGAAPAEQIPPHPLEKQTPEQHPLQPVAAKPAKVEAAEKPAPTRLAASPKRVRKSAIPAPAPEDTYDDPELALAEIKAALALVSSKINKGKKTIDKGLQEVDNVDILLKKKKDTAG